MKPEFLEILAHPLRQEILVFIEQEGETGYKDLKVKFNVATGTLYHHLRILKGLIEQNSDKKYCLTSDGKDALDVIFQENKPQVKNINNVEVVEGSRDSPTVEIQGNQFFNIKSKVETIPEWFFKVNFALFIIFPILLPLINPKVIFFHFIPISITDPIFALLIILFPLFNMGVLFTISIIKNEKISLSTIGLLIIYNNIFFVFTYITNIFQLYSNNLLIRIISIIIQILFIVFWTTSISLQYYSWEKSLLLAILQNYILFLLF